MKRSMTHTAVLAVLIPIAAGCGGGNLNPVPGAEPYERELARAAETITPETVLERIWVIAHDSMGGRDTPSEGLTKTADYFVSKYREWGVLPGGENGTYYQHYPLVKRGAGPARTYIELTEPGRSTRLTMGNWNYASRPGADTAVTAPVLIVGGNLTPEAIETIEPAGKVLLLVWDSERAADWNRWYRQILGRGTPAAIIRLRNDSREVFERGRPNPQTMRLALGLPISGPSEFSIHDSLMAANPNFDRPDWRQVRSATGPIVQLAPPGVSITVSAPAKVFEQVTAPNVIGIIPGSDPVLKNEYVIYSAHMDHVGTNTRTRTPGDTIWNGADDDASGSTGILMVAEAFQRLKVKPRRSIVIMHVSGEEKGLLGSQWYSEHPTLPVDQTVANINFDMIGRNNPDSIVVIGKEHSDMGTTLARVNQRHPAIGLTTSDDLWPEERFYFRSDHYNFARKGVPILFFFNGVHPDYHRESDELDKIDTEKTARIGQLIFYLGLEIGDTEQRPQWNPQSYAEIVEGA